MSGARLLLASCLSLASLTSSCATPALGAGAATSQAEHDIRALVANMEAAWNRGDFTGYMQAFQNPGVVFVSGGRIQSGWQGTLDHYVADYGGSPERRGALHFYDISIDMLAPDAAMLVSHYHLERPINPQEGVNTRLLRKINGRWVITLNHVSSYDPSATAPGH